MAILKNLLFQNRLLDMVTFETHFILDFLPLPSENLAGLEGSPKLLPSWPVYGNVSDN
jgi:hypothetical protein